MVLIKFFKKIKWNDIRIWLVFFAMIFLFSFSNKRNEARELGRIEVRFLDNKGFFVTTEVVNNLLIQYFPRTSKIQKSILDLNRLELELSKHDMIAEAQVYTTVDGVLMADVVQKVAIARVNSDRGSHYLDTKGDDMPMSESFSARVPVIDGVVNNANRANITRVLSAISEDDFLKTSITGIVIQPDQTLILKNRNHDFDILFGRCDEVERKFANYKAFLHYAKNDTLIDSYKTINLRFTQQVVCTKF